MLQRGSGEAPVLQHPAMQQPQGAVYDGFAMSEMATSQPPQERPIIDNTGAPSRKDKQGEPTTIAQKLWDSRKQIVVTCFITALSIWISVLNGSVRELNGKMEVFNSVILKATDDVVVVQQTVQLAVHDVQETLSQAQTALSVVSSVNKSSTALITTTRTQLAAVNTQLAFANLTVQTTETTVRKMQDSLATINGTVSTISQQVVASKVRRVGVPLSTLMTELSGHESDLVMAFFASGPAGCQVFGNLYWCTSNWCVVGACGCSGDDSIWKQRSLATSGGVINLCDYTDTTTVEFSLALAVPTS